MYLATTSRMNEPKGGMLIYAQKIFYCSINLHKKMTYTNMRTKKKGKMLKERQIFKENYALLLISIQLKKRTFQMAHFKVLCPRSVECHEYNFKVVEAAVSPQRSARQVSTATKNKVLLTTLILSLVCQNLEVHIMKLSCLFFSLSYKL